MLLEFEGKCVVRFGNCREYIFLCFVGIVDKGIVLCSGNYRGKILLCVVGIVDNR